MSQKSKLKNYYEILEIPFDASIFDIQNAYQKLAAMWHPDKHKQQRKLAQKKFHDISEAYDVLSDRNSRSHYDQLLLKQFSEEDAHKTFESFFSQNGMADESQEKFFNTHYPDRTRNYYSILGVSKHATLKEIQDAYRKLSIKYHPKNNQGNEQINKKFIEVNEAYNALSNQLKRQTYNNWLYGQIAPYRAHDIFEDFFGNRLMPLPEQYLFRPLLSKKWSKHLDNLMKDQNWDKIKDGQATKSSTVYTKDKNGECKKTITTKKAVKDGKVHQTKREQITFPNGTKEVTNTVNDDGVITTKKYNLAIGQQMPKQLTN